MVHHPNSLVGGAISVLGDMNWQKSLTSPCHHLLGLQIANDLPNHVDELSIRLFIQA